MRARHLLVAQGGGAQLGHSRVLRLTDALPKLLGLAKCYEAFGRKPICEQWALIILVHLGYQPEKMLPITQNDLKPFTGYHPEPIDRLPIKLYGCVDDSGMPARLRMLAMLAQPGVEVLISLAHVDKDVVRRAYNRADYIDAGVR